MTFPEQNASCQIACHGVYDLAEGWTLRDIFRTLTK